MSLNASCLVRLEPLCRLSAERLKELAGICSIEQSPLGADPLRGIDTYGQAVYLLNGELKINLPDGGAVLLVGGCDEANWALGHKGGMPVASKAITPVDLLRIDNNLLDILLTWDQLSLAAPAQQLAVVDGGDWQTRSGVFHAKNLSSSALSCLPSANIQELMLRLERVPSKRGEVIVREGDVGEHYYVIESGRCDVTRIVGGAELQVAELKAGDAFGEEALLCGDLRNATVRMRSDGVLWRLAKPDFVELLQAPLLHAVDRDEAQRRVAGSGACWLDVRYPSEYARDGLPGAINIPLNEIRSAFAALDPGREYIVYCQSGRRSSAAAFLLAQYGLTTAWLEGGLMKGTAVNKDGARHE